MLPENSTGLSFLGTVKWLLLILSLPCLIKAWQGIIVRQTSDGYRLLTDGAAIASGWWNLLYAFLLIGAAWAIWYFWQRYED